VLLYIVESYTLKQIDSTSYISTALEISGTGLVNFIGSTSKKSPPNSTSPSQENMPAIPYQRNSERTSIATSSASRWYRAAHYLKKHGKAIGRHFSRKSGFLDLHPRLAFNGRQKRYCPVRLLGSGGNGVVHLCRDTKVGTLVAVKTISHHDPSSPPNEAGILQQLDPHTNITQYYTMLDHPALDACLQLVFEYCELGDLDAYNEEYADSLPEMFMWHIFKHITAGLHYLHSQGVVHGDMKPANVLLAPPRHGELYPLPKLADFGTATINPPSLVPRGHFSTPAWQPPEATLHHGPESDMWALGCIIHELAGRSLPALELERPVMDPETWFELSNATIPPNTSNRTNYKYLYHYLAFHPPAPLRIDQPIASTSMNYSKLLNFMMMRALDTDYRNRVCAHELYRILTAIEPLVHKLMAVGQQSALDRFDDGRDAEWQRTRHVTDSNVFQQIFKVLALRAHHRQNMELQVHSRCLLEIMNAVDEAASIQYVRGLVPP
jgi:serine/threonine protein kinase